MTAALGLSAVQPILPYAGTLNKDKGKWEMVPEFTELQDVILATVVDRSSQEVRLERHSEVLLLLMESPYRTR